MKTLILLTIFSTWGIWCNAQSTRLPDKVKLELTRQETIQLISKLDSVGWMLRNTNYPSWFIDGFIGRLRGSIDPVLRQVGQQMRVDTVKTKGKKQ